jgi:hypothetical protein
MALNWKKWQARFLAHLGALSQAGCLTETQKISLLLFIIGEEAWNIHETFTYETGAEERTLEEVFGKVVLLLCA